MSEFSNNDLEAVKRIRPPPHGGGRKNFPVPPQRKRETRGISPLAPLLYQAACFPFFLPTFLFSFSNCFLISFFRSVILFNRLL